MLCAKKWEFDVKHVIILVLIISSIIIQWLFFVSNAKLTVYSLVTGIQIGLILFAYYCLNQAKINNHKKIVELENQYNKLNNRIKNDMASSLNVIDNISLGVIITENGKCTYVNKESVNIFHGKDYRDVIDANFSQYISTEDFNNHQCKLTTIDGIPINIEIFTIPQIVDGKKKQISIIVDITDRVAMEEKNIFIYQTVNNEKQKLELFSNISHEFSTPLNLILNAAQLNELYIENGNFNNLLYKENLKVIKTNGYRLDRTITNVLDIIKIQNGYYNVHMENENIVEFIEDIVNKTIPLVKERGKSIIFDTNVEERIIAFDRKKIERVMFNLITNAVKYTDCHGKIKVQVNSEEEQVSISCIDNGIGIPKAKLDSLFSNFTQIDKSFNRSREGMGIGLSITKAIINAHGGTIEVKSSYGIGSEFIVKLPTRIVNKEENNWDRVYKGLEVDIADIEFSDIPPKDIIKEVYERNQ